MFVNLKNSLGDPSVLDEHSHRVNIHTHGLHISPYEDDISIDLAPGESHLYEYTVPKNHAGGLHWYHPHIEGLQELNVAAGTSGALEIEDDFSGKAQLL